MAPKSTKGTTTMAEQPSTAAPEVAKKRRAPQGPRKPSPLYAFAKVTDASGQPIAGAKVELVKSMRNPHKMAEYFPTATANGESFLILTPEA